MIISDYKKQAASALENDGFYIGLCLLESELDIFRSIIFSQYLSIVTESFPSHAKKAKAIGIERYHEIAEELSHSTTFVKESRCLEESFVDVIKKLVFFKKLSEIFGDFRISDVIIEDKAQIGREEVYWRLVRPKASSDVGAIHADKWFHQIQNMKGTIFKENNKTLKVWIPIYCEPGKSGLMVVPKSHLKDWDFRIVEKNGSKKPVLVENVAPLILATEPGNLVVFTDSLLHGGIVNSGDYTRVSVEITMIFEQKIGM